MKNVILFLMLMIALKSAALAQYKSNGYVFFENNGVFDNIHMFKHITLNTWLYTYTQKIEDKFVRPIYFNAVDSAKYQIVDSLYLKQLDIKTPYWLYNPNVDSDFGWHWDRNGNLDTGPFRRFYIVEKLQPNKFRISVIVPYIGSIN